MTETFSKDGLISCSAASIRQRALDASSNVFLGVANCVGALEFVRLSILRILDILAMFVKNVKEVRAECKRRCW